MNATKLVEAYLRNRDLCINTIMAHEDRYRELLLLFEGLFDRLHDTYARLGIDEQIYIDTRSDLEIWRGNCRRDFGIDGLQNYSWLENHINLKLFRLGRLQFEPIARGGKIALNVHVPQGEPLLYDRVRESYRYAYRFFHGITNKFVCGSWLLCPALGEILPPTSNIIRFAGDYSIVRLYPESRQCEERVFNRITDDYASYPETTSLQKGVKRKLLSGVKLSAAEGEFTFEG